MGKTIALKLTKKEEQFISQMNSSGVTNSELLRAALHEYVQRMPEFSLEGMPMKGIFVKQESVSADFFELVQQLKSDLQIVQCQLERLQKQVDGEKKLLQNQVDGPTIRAPSVPQDASPIRKDVVYEVHHQIDEFLLKQTQKNCSLEETFSRC